MLTPPRILLGAITVALMMVAGVVVSPAAPAAAYGEEYARPSSGVWTITGGGWGHGHGMSQWGARAGAAAGASHPEILAAYYPNTSLASYAATDMRIELRAASAGGSVLDVEAGTLVSVAGQSAASIPAGRTRVVRTSASTSTLRIEQRGSDGVWRTWTAPWGSTHTTPVRVSPASGGLTRIITPTGVLRSYRGSLSVEANSTSSAVAATPWTPGAPAGGGVRSINHVDVESYLRGVVGRESPASWPSAALNAQAIAARTYGAQQREVARSARRSWDLCDTTSCQVYGGVHTSSGGVLTQLEDPRIDAAVSATQGRILTWEGKPIFAQFAASHGGWESYGGQPYLVSRNDPWITNDPYHTWSVEIAVAKIEQTWPQVGALTRMRISSRDGGGRWGGRVKSVVLEGTLQGAPTSITVAEILCTLAYARNSTPASAR